MTHAIVQPSGWAKPKGFSNGIVASGRTLYVGGQVGWDPTNPIPTFPQGFTAQFERALKNVLAVVEAAGGTGTDIVRMTVYVPDKAQYLASTRALGGVWKSLLGRHYPAMALVEVKSLLEEGALVEIEATAVLSN